LWRSFGISILKISTLLNALRYDEMRSVIGIWPIIEHPEEEQTGLNTKSQ